MASRRKSRQTLSAQMAAHVLVAANRTCCVCQSQHDPLQIHHIDGNPTHNAIENLAVLCLSCHHLTQTQGGFARQLDPAQVTLYRNHWLQTVAYEQGYQSAVLAFLLIALQANRRIIVGYRQRSRNVLILDTQFATLISSTAIPDRQLAHRLAQLADACHHVNDGEEMSLQTRALHRETLVPLFDHVIATLTSYLVT